MVWRIQKDHIKDCLFCIFDDKGYKKRSKMQLKKLQYPSLYSAIRPVSHSEDLTVPVRVVLITEDLENSRIDKNNDCNDALFKGSCLPIRPKFDQLEFNNL